MASWSLESRQPVYGPPSLRPEGERACAPGQGGGTVASLLGGAGASGSRQAGGGAGSTVAEPQAARPERAPSDGPAPTVVVVGAASRDVDEEDPRGWRLGGSATYGALALARLGLRVGVVLGVDPAAAGAHELDLLREAGADVRPVRLPAGPVFHMEETSNGRTLRCGDPGGPMPVASLPPSWRGAPAWYLSPVADELPDGWAAIPPGPVVALGWQGILRNLERGAMVRPRRAGPRAILRRADMVAVSTEDLDPATELRGLLRLLRTGALLTVTRGARGGLAVAVRPGSPRMRRFPAVPKTRTVDSTGAGDVFLAALLAARIAPELGGRRPHLPAALRFASAVAATRVGARGLAGVPTLAQVAEALRRPPPA